MADKPKVKIKDFEFTLTDECTALVLSIQELTQQINRLVAKR